jgi:alpha-ketoglutarate-dependent taurine dioxygenase
LKPHDTELPSIKKIGEIKRKAVSFSRKELVRLGKVQHGQPSPVLIEPALSGVKLAGWAAMNRELIRSSLYEHGAALFRNFDLSTPAEFEQVIKAISGKLLEYGDQTSPRHKVRGNIYTSTDHPPDQPIFLHNENSYSHTWPLKIFFFCATPAQRGGETPIADTRRVFHRIDPDIRNRFIEKRWMLVRNMGERIGLPWETVFQTTDKAAIEEYCRKSGIDVEWRSGNRLRTRQVRPAVLSHPLTGEMLWFNHATFFHVSTLEPRTREALSDQFEEEDLPYNTYYGDGTQIEPSVLDALREAYLKEMISFPWQKADLLMLDNMLTAHGRAPFFGARNILVGMAEPFNA